MWVSMHDQVSELERHNGCTCTWLVGQAGQLRASKVVRMHLVSMAGE